MNALTLFAGAGGADIGLQRAGFTHLACVEGDATACATLRAAGFPAVHAWIGGPGPDGQPAWRWDGTPVDLLWASPPCQPYSRAGKRLGAEDTRDGWPATLATIAEVRPQWVIIENVRGAPVDQWECKLAALGYTTSAALLDAADWGLPSHRNRWYLVAGPRGYRWPDPTHYGPQVPWLVRGQRLPWVGFGDALGLVGAVRATRESEAGKPVAEREEQIIKGPSQCIGATYSGTLGGQPYVLLPGNGGNLPAPRAPVDPAHTVTANTVTYLLSGPCLTITTVDGVGMGSKNSRDWLQSATSRRRLTWQECAILVGFPAGYPFQGTTEARYRQVGNAVAPVMAEALGVNLW